MVLVNLLYCSVLSVCQQLSGHLAPLSGFLKVIGDDVVMFYGMNRSWSLSKTTPEIIVMFLSVKFGEAALLN